MELPFYKLLFDFGLLVLIWMVQLVVYPSFIFMDRQRLIVWHTKYTMGISIIVIPLMLAQLILSLLIISRGISFFKGIDVFLVLLVWVLTFTIFVPAHRAIASGQSNELLLGRLVAKNWYRTIIWTVVFLLNLIFSVRGSDVY